MVETVATIALEDWWCSRLFVVVFVTSMTFALQYARASSSDLRRSVAPLYTLSRWSRYSTKRLICVGSTGKDVVPSSTERTLSFRKSVSHSLDLLTPRRER